MVPALLRCGFYELKHTCSIVACRHPSGGYAAAPGHDPHVLYTLSAVQILVSLDRLKLEVHTLCACNYGISCVYLVLRWRN